MRGLTQTESPDLLVGALSGDDAAVWRIDDDRALVVTADFITPVVDDPFHWGQIAAANAVSDVYAMGGHPLLALNLLCWNTNELSNEQLSQVLAGGHDIAKQCGIVMAGGHTVDDPEPKYGMAVIGEVHPDKMLTNAGFRADQTLILTKPLGIGVITTGLKWGRANTSCVDAAVASMVATNAAAAKTAVACGATGATDVTGFGLLGHGGRAAEESVVDFEIIVDDVPIIDGARELASSGVVPGGTGRNLNWVNERVDRGEGVSELDVTLLADAQTSGGLLFAVDQAQAQDALVSLLSSGHKAACIGQVRKGKGQIQLKPTGGSSNRWKLSVESTRGS